MKINALDHIVLNVADCERSLAFYGEVLGLAGERVEDWRAGKVSFPSVRVNDATIIDLVARERPGENLNHFCLVTDGSIEAVLAELARHGIAIERGPVMVSGARGNALGVYVRDPDQNLVEVRSYPSAA